MKVCTKCLVAQPLENFGKQSANRNGLAYQCKSCAAEYQRKRYDDPAYKDYQRNISLIASYGITLKEYNQMYENQGGLCAICNQPESRTHGRTGEPMLLAVDHCHSTDAVRGLLCGSCNFMIGLAKDSTEILTRAAQYLSAQGVRE